MMTMTTTTTTMMMMPGMSSENGKGKTLQYQAERKVRDGKATLVVYLSGSLLSTWQTPSPESG